MRNTTRIRAGLLALTLAALCAGCGQAPAPESPPAPSPAAASGIGERNYWRGPEEKKYTSADYQLLLSLQSEGYEQQTVAAFNKAVLNWEDEAAYHKAEGALERLWNTLPETDPAWSFLAGPVRTSWKECQKKHYNACAGNGAPWCDGWASVETHGDIYGDDVVLSGGYLNFDFNYQVEDEGSLTVAQRDAELKSISTGMQEFLEGQSKAALQDEEKLEKTLQTELERRLKAWSGGLTWGGEGSVSYYYNQPWGEYEAGPLAEGSTESSSWNGAPHYTKAHYDRAVQSLRFENYEAMPVAEFDRRINEAFEKDEGEENGVQYAYEMVRSMLEETDPNYRFFSETVPMAIEEYDARARTVFSGKQVDPERHARAYADLEADVYGDSVVTGNAEGDYTYTYRLLRAEALTVAQRDAFLKAVEEGVQEKLAAALKEGGVTEAAFKALVEETGKAASTDLIQFTGCEIGYFEVWR